MAQAIKLGFLADSESKTQSQLVSLSTLLIPTLLHSRSCTSAVAQLSKETSLAVEDKVVLIELFRDDHKAAKIYLALDNEELRLAWLKKAVSLAAGSSSSGPFAPSMWDSRFQSSQGLHAANPPRASIPPLPLLSPVTISLKDSPKGFSCYYFSH
ncbi:hypothetical protein BS47DRAFT_1393361 [Hydnum rufescens UP504]|uniref:Uncharacterized protein n=1 Tax=Hydnum rufescens UP504 TaxID=1448309 RepID=A0A9P6DX12_9AGAM|nr:hypothetical protein BS47DRAFT_1393361 [Hydnum rufescens UP504]